MEYSNKILPKGNELEPTTEALCYALRSKEAILNYLADRGKKHENYKSYMSEERAKASLESHFLYLGSPYHWNDTRDSDQFDEQKAIYAKCFSYSSSENVAMWMLYADKPYSKDGCLIDYTQGLIQNALNSESIILCWDKEEIICTDKHSFSIEMRDVLYYSVNDNAVKRSTHYVSKVPINVEEACKCYIKDFPWNYENECRMIVKISSEYLKALGKEKPKYVKIHLGDNKRQWDTVIKSRTFFSPQRDTGLGRESCLGNTISWDLCKCCVLQKRLRLKRKNKIQCQ